MHTHSPRHRGFTLIETVSALVILSVAIPPMLWAVRHAHSQRVNPMMASQARWLASEKIEDIVADRNSATRGFSYLTAGNYAAENPVTGYAAFSRTVSFTQTAADLVTPGSGYMRATVTVSWSDDGGVSRSLALATVLTDY